MQNSETTSFPKNSKEGSIYLVAFAAFSFLFSTQLVAPVMPELTKLTKANNAQAAAIISSAMVALVLFRLVSGGLADRFGKRKVLMLGVLLGATSSFCTLFVQHWQILFLLRLASGMADAITLPALLGLTTELGKGREEWAFGVLRGSQGLAFVLGPALGGLLASQTFLRAPFLVDSVMTLLAGTLVFRLVKTASPVNQFQWLRSVKRLFTGRFYAYALFGMANTFAVPIVWTFLPIKAQGVGYQEVGIAFLLTTEAIAFAASSFLIGTTADRMVKKHVVIASQVLIISSLLLMAVVGAYPLWLVAMLLYGIGGAGTFLMATVYAAQATEDSASATTMGGFDAMVDLAMAAGPLIIVPITALIGSLDVSFILAMPLAILSLLVAIWLPEDDNKDRFGK